MLMSTQPDQASSSQTDERYHINVEVKTKYMASHSKPEGKHYAFTYHISITNKGNQTAQLLTRHWYITNSDGETQEVKGDGVIGEQPVIQPGQSHHYSSGTWLTTNIGFMQGYFGMKSSDGNEFKATIHPFTLAAPGVLH